MRAAFIGFAAALIGPIATSGAQATPLSSYTDVQAAIGHATVVQKVPYVCRRGPAGRECYYVSPPDSNPRTYSNGVNPYYQPRPYVGPGPYDYHHWGGPDGPQ
jgi:hypothetical protein